MEMLLLVLSYIYMWSWWEGRKEGNEELNRMGGLSDPERLGKALVWLSVQSRRVVVIVLYYGKKKT